MLKECGEEKARGALHPKCRRSKLLPLSTFYFILFFGFLLLEKKKDAKEKVLETKGQKQEAKSKSQK